MIFVRPPTVGGVFQSPSMVFVDSARALCGPEARVNKAEARRVEGKRRALCWGVWITSSGEGRRRFAIGRTEQRMDAQESGKLKKQPCLEPFNKAALPPSSRVPLNRPTSEARPNLAKTLATPHSECTDFEALQVGEQLSQCA